MLRRIQSGQYRETNSGYERMGFVQTLMQACREPVQSKEVKYGTQTLVLYKGWMNELGIRYEGKD
jgi:hypothetical protein